MPERNDDTDRFEALGRRARDRAEAGGLEPSLYLELQNQLAIFSQKMETAERQRVEILLKLEESRTEAKVLNHTVVTLTDTLKKVEDEQKQNTEFRLKFLGGSLVARLFWLGLGGIGVWVLQNFWKIAK